jgi:hypothetical protein
VCSHKGVTILLLAALLISRYAALAEPSRPVAFSHEIHAEAGVQVIYGHLGFDVLRSGRSTIDEQMCWLSSDCRHRSSRNSTRNLQMTFITISDDSSHPSEQVLWGNIGSITHYNWVVYKYFVGLCVLLLCVVVIGLRVGCRWDKVMVSVHAEPIRFLHATGRLALIEMCTRDNNCNGIAVIQRAMGIPPTDSATPATSESGGELSCPGIAMIEELNKATVSFEVLCPTRTKNRPFGPRSFHHDPI